nr:MAG TPA: hypothetical protein [Caudoviricetes sp.]
MRGASNSDKIYPTGLHSSAFSLYTFSFIKNELGTEFLTLLR